MNATNWRTTALETTPARPGRLPKALYRHKWTLYPVWLLPVACELVFFCFFFFFLVRVFLHENPKQPWQKELRQTFSALQSTLSILLRHQKSNWIIFTVSEDISRYKSSTSSTFKIDARETDRQTDRQRNSTSTADFVSLFIHLIVCSHFVREPYAAHQLPALDFLFFPNLWHLRQGQNVSQRGSPTELI